MTSLFERILLPVADPDDARATCAALAGYDVGSVVAVHVIEKAGGAPDKASVQQREDRAAEIFGVVAEGLPDGVPLETEVVYGTDVAEAIFGAADGASATAIVITPRGGSRWIRLLTGDVALSLVTENDRPVVVLPDSERAVGGSVEDSVVGGDGTDPGDGADGTDGADGADAVDDADAEEDATDTSGSGERSGGTGEGGSG